MTDAAPTELSPLSYTTLFRSTSSSTGAGVSTATGARVSWRGVIVGATATSSGSGVGVGVGAAAGRDRSEEHTSELQSLTNLVCRLLLEKKKRHDRLPQRPTTT